MTDPLMSVVAEVEAFCERYQIDPVSVEPTSLRFLFDGTPTDEIDAALAELRARPNGTSRVDDP
jgi:hypothetical protein